MVRQSRQFGRRRWRTPYFNGRLENMINRTASVCRMLFTKLKINYLVLFPGNRNWYSIRGDENYVHIFRCGFIQNPKPRTRWWASARKWETVSNLKVNATEYCSGSSISFSVFFFFLSVIFALSCALRRVAFAAHITAMVRDIETPPWTARNRHLPVITVTWHTGNGDGDDDANNNNSKNVTKAKLRQTSVWRCDINAAPSIVSEQGVAERTGEWHQQTKIHTHTQHTLHQNGFAIDESEMHGLSIAWTRTHVHRDRKRESERVRWLRCYHRKH